MKRRGFTQVDLMLLVAVLGILIALLLPALARAREAARSATCQNNLRQFGIGMQIFGERDARKRYCSGSFDFKNDGCPDANSWVGNLVNLGAGFPAEMLCPSSELRGNEKLNELIGNDEYSAVATFSPGVKMAWVTDTFCDKFKVSLHADDGGAANPNGTLANKDGDDDNPRIAVVRTAVKNGYNTNYAASWFLTRGTQKFVNGKDKNAGLIYTQGDQRNLSGGYEGLEVRWAEQSHVAMSAIPLLGDAGAGDISVAVLTDPLNAQLLEGSRLTISAGDGPAFLTQTDKYRIARLSTACSITPGVADEKLYAGAPVDRIKAVSDDTLPLPDEEDFGGVDLSVPPDGKTDRLDNLTAYGGADGHLFLQDTRQWMTLHGSGRNKSCNIMFADSAVKTIYDMNADGYLNPGFPINTALDRDELEAVIGYSNRRCEVGPATLFCGPWLDFRAVKKAKFE
jgi:type II secretory pathway pseudopilin PulG